VLAVGSRSCIAYYLRCVLFTAARLRARMRRDKCRWVRVFLRAQFSCLRLLCVWACVVFSGARVCVGARFFLRRAPSLSRVNPSPSPPPAHSLLRLSRAASTLASQLLLLTRGDYSTVRTARAQNKDLLPICADPQVYGFSIAAPRRRPCMYIDVFAKKVMKNKNNDKLQVLFILFSVSCSSVSAL
jgi:hypothetical protein